MRSLTEDRMMSSAWRSLGDRPKTWVDEIDPIERSVLDRLYKEAQKPEPAPRFTFDVYALPHRIAEYRTWVRLAGPNQEAR